jgi:hypothetical protein
VSEVEGESGEPGQLPIRVDHLFTSMQFYAGGSAQYLYESWQRPVRHNKKLERLALWHTVNLELECESALSFDTSPPLVPFTDDVGPPEVRYDVETAIRLMPRLFPFFMSSDLARLRALPDRSFDDWGEAMAEREPELVASWHAWLWPDDYPPGDHGRASELAVAASRLADGLKVVLGWDA